MTWSGPFHLDWSCCSFRDPFLHILSITLFPSCPPLEGQQDLELELARVGARGLKESSVLYPDASCTADIAHVFIKSNSSCERALEGLRFRGLLGMLWPQNG